MGKHGWPFLLAGLLVLFLGLMTWSIYRADKGVSQTVEEYLRGRP